MGDDTAEMGAGLLPGVDRRRHFLFYVFVVIFLILLILGLTIFRV